MNSIASAAAPWYRNLDLPWSHSSNQEQRYRRIQIRVLGIILLLSLLIQWLPVPDLPPPLLDIAPQPIQLKIVLPPKPPAPQPPPAPIAKPEIETPVPPKPLPKPIVPETPQPVRSSAPGSAPPGPNAHDRAAAKISQLADDLADLRDSTAASKAITGRADMKGPPNANYTSDLNGGTASGTGSERSLITAKAGESSGGINTAGLSRGTGGGGLAGRGTTQVAGYGVGGGNGKGGGGNGNGTGTGNGTGSGSGSGGSRSREEIEMIFDQNKGAIYALYNRALRENPGLQGKMVLRLTIQPNGVVSACEVVSSELNAPDFEHRLVQRVLLFKFEARDVSAVTTTKPIDFFPS